MSRTWVAIDFETATRERASACALGIAVIEGGRIVETRDWLMRPPGNRFEWMNTRVHGIDARTVAREPGFGGVWPEIEPYLSGAALLAHNASFDMAVLRASLGALGLDPPRVVGYHCTVAMARTAWPDLSDHRLPTVSRHCGFELNHHDAGSDAHACAAIALGCCDAVGAASLDELATVTGMRLKAL